ncbi:Nucleotidyltransferase [Xylariaceae sp. FL0016]|nr:Nucleotidyltransferase [Xylariaceae sp. FL0016]
MALDFPPVFLLPTHFEPEDLAAVEGQIPTLTYDIREAKVIIGKISKTPRAKFELRSRNLAVEDVNSPISPQNQHAGTTAAPPAKRRKVFEKDRVSIGSDASTASDSEDSDKSPSTRHPIIVTQEDRQENPPGQAEAMTLTGKPAYEDDSIVNVVKLAWFTDSVLKGMVLPVDDYLVYRGRKLETTTSPGSPNSSGIPKRAREEEPSSNPSPYFNLSPYASTSRHSRTNAHAKRPPLMQESTSEHDIIAALPPIPDYLRTSYACQRPTPFNPPNSAFVEQLKQMRSIRTLQGDEVGVRAYSSSIAAIAAYPHLISHHIEVERLPGCGPKIVELYKQWSQRGFLDDIRNADQDPKMKVLMSLYNIWGVGAKTAHDFFAKGWHDREDIIEKGWDQLSRVQQIGVKFYDELQERIPRKEVESIANIVLDHANKRKKGFQMVIVGGYRRGKETSGDVDVLLSHPDPEATSFLIGDITNSLEADGYVTHILTFSEKNSERGQTPVSWKGEGARGSGFDTLDKALVIWQNPKWDKSASSKNPNPHRRVDIIISPWRTVGCAVVGWTGGTTFERDLRRYCKAARALKFDSSGVRERTDGGHWVDIESDEQGNPALDMLTAEKRAFKNLELEWLPPGERCTG